MAGFRRFLIRVVLSVVIAYILGRIFFQSASAAKILILALVMLVFAYLFEYTRKKDGKT